MTLICKRCKKIMWNKLLTIPNVYEEGLHDNCRTLDVIDSMAENGFSQGMIEHNISEIKRFEMG